MGLVKSVFGKKHQIGVQGAEVDTGAIAVAWGNSFRPEEEEGNESSGRLAGKRGRKDIQGGAWGLGTEKKESTWGTNSKFRRF